MFTHFTLAVIIASSLNSVFAPPLPTRVTEISPTIPLQAPKVLKIEPLPASQMPEISNVADVPAPKPKPVATYTAPAPKPPVAPVQAPQPQVAHAAPVTTGGCVSGWFSGDYYLDKIVAYESGGNSCATNPGGCFGLLQACPGYPLRAACGGSPSCQIAWFQANKTGGRSWYQIWQHELAFGWW